MKCDVCRTHYGYILREINCNNHTVFYISFMNINKSITMIHSTTDTVITNMCVYMLMLLIIVSSGTVYLTHQLCVIT